MTRVSVEGDRMEERLYSYSIQANRIAEDCEANGFDLLRVGKERTISGGADLRDRPELLAAVEAVERGEADIIIAAYFDRPSSSSASSSPMTRPSTCTLPTPYSGTDAVDGAWTSQTAPAPSTPL